jgi:hypothetical protein
MWCPLFIPQARTHRDASLDSVFLSVDPTTEMSDENAGSLVQNVVPDNRNRKRATINRSIAEKTL